MRLKSLWRATLYVALLAAMLLSAAQLYVPKTSAAVCCTYGNECEGYSLCCQPESGQAKCSANKPNYCQAYCGAPPE